MCSADETDNAMASWSEKAAGWTETIVKMRLGLERLVALQIGCPPAACPADCDSAAGIGWTATGLPAEHWVAKAAAAD
jgi:hypothetical protein